MSSAFSHDGNGSRAGCRMREFGAVQGGQTRNLGAPIQADEDAVSAAGTPP